jgi:hypothetical protein
LGWPAAAYREMVGDTLRLMPPSLARVLQRNERALVEGAERGGPMVRGQPKVGSAASGTARELDSRLKHIAHMVNQLQPFREIARELGQVLRTTADLADPVAAAEQEPLMGRAAVEYERFVLAHLDRFPVVYDRSVPSLLGGASTEASIGRLTESARHSAARLSRAFFREGRLLPAAEFDYRSVPFAEASLSYSRAVTAAAHFWLFAWSEANGDLTGTPFVEPPPKMKSARGKRSQ